MVYLVQIEPVYTQGVGHYQLITNNIQYVDAFRNQLVNYKNDLKKHFSDDELECSWELNEYIYKLVDYDETKMEFNGYCVHDKKYAGNFEQLVDVDVHLLNGVHLLENQKISEFEYDNVLLLDYVYNFIDSNEEPVHISHFQIINF
jgi:hypothetical protein